MQVDSALQSMTKNTLFDNKVVFFLHKCFLAIVKKTEVALNYQKTVPTFQIGLLELPGAAQRVLHIRA